MMKRILWIATIVVMLVVLIACGTSQAENSKSNTSGTAEAGTPPAAVDTSAGLIKVVTQTMTYERFDHYFEANGTIEAVQDAYISPEINGQVKKVHVKDGQRVKKGELLVSLNSDVIESGIAEVESGLDLARTVYNKRKDLWEKKIGSEIQYLQAKTDKDSLENKLKSLKAQLRMARITAPFNGIVDKVFIKEGELAAPGVQIMQLVNLSKIYVNAEVSEAYLPRVHKGDAVTVSFPTYPELTIESVIYRTGNVIKPQNRTFLVQLMMDNPGEKLKPNSLAVVKMRDFSAESALVVPSIIIKNDLTGSYLYVVEKDQKNGKTIAEKVYVTQGMSEGSRSLVEKGLKSGQKVIVKGYNLVKNGMEVQLVTK